MAAFKIQSYGGILPRFPESLLPERAATVAENCDFAYGELRNTKDGYLVNTMSNTPSSIYTDDGLTFFTWGNDVNAVRSPLVADTFQRLYFTDGSQMKVADRRAMRTTGGPPDSQYYVGVPRPTTKPTVSAPLPKLDAAKQTFEVKFHYEFAGVKYQETNLTADSVVEGTSTGPIAEAGTYTFTPPSKYKELTFNSLDEFPETGESGIVYRDVTADKVYTYTGGVYAAISNQSTGATPVEAVPVLRITSKSRTDETLIFDIYSDNSSFAAATGLYSMTLTKNGDGITYTAKITVGVREADKETRAYVYTYVNTYNEEGPPSDPVLVETSPLLAVDVAVTRDAISNYAPIKEIRVYRTPTGSTIASYFYVGFIPVLTQEGSSFTLHDDTKAEAINEPLSTLYDYPPPVGLVGLMSLPNGILCAWKDNELWFSEAYRPWAWNPNNAKPLPHRIVGGIAHGSGAVITTVATPYLVSGVSPDSMTVARVNVEQAGVSKWSLAVADGAVVYASNDGLVVMSGATATLAKSAQFFTREVWRGRYATGLPTMRFSVWDGRLVVFSSLNAFTPFMIRLDEADGTMTELPSFYAQCAFISQVSDQFYYARNTGLYQFNGGAALSATWQSRELVLARPVSFGTFQSVVEGSWTISFYADGVLKHTQSVAAGKNTYRLPGGFKSDRWKVRISGSGRFRELRVATAGVELATL